jgi:hypothetical protein
LDFREGVLEDFAIVFEGAGESNAEGAVVSEDFAEKWGWFGVMYRLANAEIVNLQRITELGLLECLTWLSYETDLNINRSVKLNNKNGSI